MNEPAEDLILRAAIQLSPTPEVKQAFEKMYNTMVMDNFPEDKRIIALTHAISDGLSYGNWLN